MEQEYLISYGVLGDFGRFRSSASLDLQRSDAVVARTSRGIELGEVLCPSSSRHIHLLPGHTVGELIRAAGENDLCQAVLQEEQAREIFAAAQELAQGHQLPLEILDVELLLDGEHLILHYVHWKEFDPRDFVSGLSRRFDVQVCLQDLSDPSHNGMESDGSQSCGSGGCGSGGCGSGGCSSGGCGSGGCGSGVDLQEYFAALREKMNHSDRASLL